MFCHKVRLSRFFWWGGGLYSCSSFHVWKHWKFCIAVLDLNWRVFSLALTCGQVLWYFHGEHFWFHPLGCRSTLRKYISALIVRSHPWPLTIYTTTDQLLTFPFSLLLLWTLLKDNQKTSWILFLWLYPNLRHHRCNFAMTDDFWRETNKD